MRQLRQKFVRLSGTQRLYGLDRPLVALTGGIATGKSTVARMLEARGIAIIDADKLVKKIYQSEEARGFIQEKAPEAWRNGEIDFPLLREKVFSDHQLKASIEQFVYARLPEAFRAEAPGIKEQSFLVYDVPLLFERKLEEKMDLTILVYAPRELQLSRLIHRDGTKIETAKKILSEQMDIEEKRSRADFVIENSGTLEELSGTVARLVKELFD